MSVTVRIPTILRTYTGGRAEVAAEVGVAAATVWAEVGTVGSIPATFGGCGAFMARGLRTGA